MITALQIIFWVSVFLVVYTYIGYGFILFLMVKIKRMLGWSDVIPEKPTEFPEVTFVVAAYNEQDWIVDKINNTLDLEYPKDKIKYFFVTDGSNDRTPEIIQQYPQIKLFHRPERAGKIAAVERIMEFVETPIVIYTDANTMVNKEAIYNIVRHYENPKVGAVAGEKRISMDAEDAANAAGEGIYWKYESSLKRWDSELYSVVGAAGELFSLRTEMYEAVPKDTIIEDFYMTLRIAQKGYKVRYEPNAYAVEGPSASVKEELKRKIRIAAGGIQAIVRLAPLLNIFKYGMLTFQYVSHRVLRWTLAPLVLPLILATNIALAVSTGGMYLAILMLQVLFYAFAAMGYVFEQKKIKVKAFFVPYYFCIMNYAVYRGFMRNWAGSQSVMWEKAKRA
ncbi:MAG: glycosyltransferase family 2 protein [Chitinophagales bacterium]